MEAEVEGDNIVKFKSTNNDKDYIYIYLSVIITTRILIVGNLR